MSATLRYSPITAERTPSRKPVARGASRMVAKEPLAARPYRESRAQGALVLVDTASHKTAAAVLVMVYNASVTSLIQLYVDNLREGHARVRLGQHTLSEREARLLLGHYGIDLWTRHLARTADEDVFVRNAGGFETPGHGLGQRLEQGGHQPRDPSTRARKRSIALTTSVPTWVPRRTS